jgi:hypothetical protein
MALSKDAQLVIEFFIQQGMFSEDDLARFVGVIRSMRSIGGGGAAPAKRRGRPKGSGSKKATSQKSTGKRGARQRITATTAQLRKMYVTDGMTAKAIAEQFGVSAGGVAQRLMKDGISKNKKKAAGKKKAGKKLGKKKAKSKKKAKGK